MTLYVKLGWSIILIFFYYSIIKRMLRYPAYILARMLKLTKKHSVEEAKGAVGFILVLISHTLFATLLYLILGVNYQQLGLNLPKFSYLLLGSLLGLGMAGTAMILCLGAVKITTVFSRYSEQQIMLALPGGWLKSYEYIKVVAPSFVFLPAIILQLACEEIIFRGVFINYFISFGVMATVIISTLLFTLMQLFLMPTWRGVLFPMIGALLIGVVHGYLFLIIGSIWPFILSHTIFFMLFVA